MKEIRIELPMKQPSLKDMIGIYPCTIIHDRYGGVYSGGDWTAWPLDWEFVPEDIDCDDGTCQNFWESYREPVGRGSTPDKALADLEKRLKECAEQEKCPFIIAWQGQCGKPGNPYCKDHKDKKCSYCGKQATRECCFASSLVCGRPLCEECSCNHDDYAPPLRQEVGSERKDTDP